MGLLALVLLAVAYYFLLLSPLMQEYSDRYDERTQKEGQEAQLEKTVADLESAQSTAPEIERQILEYSKRIPDQDELPTLLVQMEEVAQEANVTQLSIEPSPRRPRPAAATSRVYRLRCLSKEPMQRCRTSCSGSGTWHGW